MERGDVDKLITEDGKGRMPEVIARGEPAIMVCHWPGISFNGERVGFNIFKEAVTRLHARYDNLLWMKLSEIAPGVNTPLRSRGAPCGSVREKATVIVPSCEIPADVILIVNPGRTNATSLGSA